MATRARIEFLPLAAILVWLKGQAGRRVLAALLLLVAGTAAFALHDKLLGLPVVREDWPVFDPYHALTTLFALALSTFLARNILAGRARPCRLDSSALAPVELAVALAAMAAAVGVLVLFLLDPREFHAFAQEDRPVEAWSARLLFIASGLFAFQSVRRRDAVSFVVAAGLCLVLFVVGMEEISWMQRVIGFSTPEKLAEVNWQHEFNLHNVQTDLSETAYYFGAAIFLVCGPFLRDVVPERLLKSPLLAYLPTRSVALASAPVAAFTYGEWNLFPLQLATALAVVGFVIWSDAARRRGNRLELLFFASAAMLVVVGQVIVLALGRRMVEIPDASEYKEFFIAFGFAWYALTIVCAKRLEDARGGEPV